MRGGGESRAGEAAQASAGHLLSSLRASPECTPPRCDLALWEQNRDKIAIYVSRGNLTTAGRSDQPENHQFHSVYKGTPRHPPA